jgi:chromosome segregation ATPase
MAPTLQETHAELLEGLRDQGVSGTSRRPATFNNSVLSIVGKMHQLETDLEDTTKQLDTLKEVYNGLLCNHGTVMREKNQMTNRLAEVIAENQRLSTGLSQAQQTMTVMSESLHEQQEAVSDLEDDLMSVREELEKRLKELNMANTQYASMKREVCLLKGESLDEYSQLEMIAGMATMATGQSRVAAELERRQEIARHALAWGVSMCFVCRDENHAPNMVFSGCGHMVCSHCGPQLNECPYCKVQSEPMKVYGVERMEQ